MKTVSIKRKPGNPPSARPHCSATFAEWCKIRGVWPRLTHEEIWYTAWNAAIEDSLLKTPGGSICDLQSTAKVFVPMNTLNSNEDQRAAGSSQLTGSAARANFHTAANALRAVIKMRHTLSSRAYVRRVAAAQKLALEAAIAYGREQIIKGQR